MLKVITDTGDEIATKQGSVALAWMNAIFIPALGNAIEFRYPVSPNESRQHATLWVCFSFLSTTGALLRTLYETENGLYEQK